MSRIFKWATTTTRIELRLQESPTHSELRFVIKGGARPSGRGLFELDDAPQAQHLYTLPAALLILTNVHGQTISADALTLAPDVQARHARVVLPAGHPDVRQDQHTLVLESPLELDALWVNGLDEGRATALQNQFSLLPGLMFDVAEGVRSLGSALLIPNARLHPLPRVVLKPRQQIADNSDPTLSMRALVEGFTQRFGAGEDTLPRVDVATGYLFFAGLERLLELLANARIATVRLLFSGHTGARAARALTALFTQQLETTFQDDPGGLLWETARSAVEEERLQVRVYTRAFLHAKLFLAWHPRRNQFGELLDASGIVGSSNVTRPGLHSQGNLELNVVLSDPRRVDELLSWFDTRWAEADPLEPDLLHILAEHQPPPPPEFDTPGLIDVWEQGRRGRLAPPSAHLELLADTYHDHLQVLPPEDRATLFPPTPGRSITPAPEQIEGAQGIIQRLELVRLAFLADSVGLGKTITAIGAAWSMHDRGLCDKVLLVAPRKLFSQWDEDARRIGAPEGLLTKVNRHTLERADPRAAQVALKGADLILVEEAHQSLRNRHNKLWLHLRNHLKQNRRCRVLLISATPWNNSREDIFNYLLLAWADPWAFLDYPGMAALGLYNFRGLFNGVSPGLGARTFNGLPPESYQRFFDATFVQRTRHGLRTLYGHREDFPERLPHAHQAPEAPEYDRFLDRLRDLIPSIHLTHYQPFLAFQRAFAALSRSESPGSNLFSSFLVQLYKRAESSLFALAMSLASLVDRTHQFLHQLNALHDDPEPLEALHAWLSDIYLRLDEEATDEEGEAQAELMTPEETRRYANLNELLKNSSDQQVRDAINHLIKRQITPDLERFDDLLGRLSLELEQSDPKATVLLQHAIAHHHAGHKPILIASYADTATRAFIRLCHLLPNARIGLALGGNEAWIHEPSSSCPDLTEAQWSAALNQRDPQMRRVALLKDARRASPSDREAVLGRFAPRSKGYTSPLAEASEIDVLVGSEAISVGQNLQDSTALIQLDLPWNPMVIEQRIGRIDRRGGGRVEPDPKTGKPRRVVDVHYSWSVEAIDRELILRQRLQRKITSAMADTYFDELLLHELRDRLKEHRDRHRSRVQRQQLSLELGQALDTRQRQAVEELTHVPDTRQEAGSDLDGLRLLEQWATDHGSSTRPATPLACGGSQHTFKNDACRWLLTLELTPRGPGGAMLTSEPLIHNLCLDLEPDPLQLHDNLEALTRRLLDLDHSTPRPDGSVRAWTRRLRTLDDALQSYRRRCLDEHNEACRQRAREQAATTRRDPTATLRTLFGRAYDSLVQHLEELDTTAKGQAWTEEHIEPLEFLIAHIFEDPSTAIPSLLIERTQRELENPLGILADMPKLFFDDFDHRFHALCGDLYTAHKAADTPTVAPPEPETIWHHLDLDVLVATTLHPEHTS